MVGQPGASQVTGLQTYEDVTAQASRQMEQSKQNSNTAPGATGVAMSSGGGGGGAAAPPSTNYQDSKADFIKSTAGLTTLNESAPVAPGSDPRLMSTLSGAAAGAAAGSVVPGWGTAIGAVVGGAVGYFKGAKMKKEADKAYDDAMKKRKEEMAIMTRAKNTSLRKYETGKTQHFMAQAESLYGGSGKVVGIARRGGIVYSPIQVVIYDRYKPIQKLDRPFTADMVRKAAKGAKVELEERVMLCSRADGSCSLRKKSEMGVPVFRRGGSVVNKMKRNIIPHGVLHEEENNTGVKGDKGIPIVQNGEKMFELERSEWVLNSEISKSVQDKVYKYLKEPSDDLLKEIGGIIQKELHMNTYSYDEDYAHLNH